MTYEIISTRKYRKIIQFKNPNDIHLFLKRYAKSKQEHFLVITLNGSLEVIAVHIATIGLANKTIIHPREVFYHAIKDNASAVILAHNHPSNNASPSQEDDEITERLYAAAKILGIYLVDHIIISKNKCYSYRNNGNILE